MNNIKVIVGLVISIVLLPILILTLINNLAEQFYYLILIIIIVLPFWLTWGVVYLITRYYFPAKHKNWF